MTDIEAYRRLDEGDVTLVEIPDDLAHPNQVQRIEDAVGAIAVEPLMQGEPLRRERLGQEARDVLLGDDDDLVLLALPRAEQWAPGRVDLVALAPEGPCLLAQDLRSHGTAEPGILTLTAPAAMALALRWRLEQQPVIPLARNPVDRGRRDELACAQALPISRIDVPSGLGVVVGLPGPATAVHTTHAHRARPELLQGTDALWLHGLEAGRAGVLVDRAGRPPLVLDVVVGEGVAQGKPLSPGGYAELRGDGPVRSAAVWPPDGAELEVLDDRVLAFGRTPGWVEVATVHDGGVALHTLEVLPGWPALGRGEPVVPLKPGKRRKVKLPDGIVRAFSADRSVATVEAAGTKARVTAVAPGTTEVVFQAPDGRLTHVRVVVLPGR